MCWIENLEIKNTRINILKLETPSKGDH